MSIANGMTSSACSLTAGVDLRIRYEWHLELTRDGAEPGNPEIDVSGGEAALLDATLQSCPDRDDVEDHAVNHSPGRKPHLAEADELRAAAADDHFGHSDSAVTDFDTHASRSHQTAPDDENEPNLSRTSENMLLVGLPVH